MLARLLPLAGAPVELAEAEVAVGDERAHAQLLGQGQGLAIVRLRGVGLDAVGMGRDVAEQSQELALHPPFPPLPSRREPVLGDPGGVRQPPVEEVRPAERPDAAGPPRPPHGPLGEARAASSIRATPSARRPVPWYAAPSAQAKSWSGKGTSLVRQRSRPRSSGATAPAKSP